MPAFPDVVHDDACLQALTESTLNSKHVDVDDR